MKNPYPIPDGYAPCDLWNAYNLTAARNQLGCPNSEPCGTVAVVNFDRDPTIAEDLVEYREAAFLRACNPTTGSGCVVEMNQHGETGTKDLPPVDPTGNAAIEWAIDVDMVSANCPKCRIYAVEADFSPDDNKFNANMAEAENTAARKIPNVVAIDNSWDSLSMGEVSTPKFEDAFNHKHIAIVVAAGDEGYGDVISPADYNTVTSVVGSSLRPLIVLREPRLERVRLE